MKGIVLHYDTETRRGVIEDHLQNRYDFHIGEWLSDESVQKGKEVFFETPKNEAVNIQIKRENILKKFFRKGKKLF